MSTKRLHPKQFSDDENDCDQNRGFAEEEKKGEEEDVEERKQDRLETCQTQRSQSHPNEDPPFFV